MASPPSPPSPPSLPSPPPQRESPSASSPSSLPALRYLLLRAQVGYGAEAQTILHSPPEARQPGRAVIICFAGLSGTKKDLVRHKRCARLFAHGYGLVLCDHYNAGERRVKSAGPSNQDGWARCQRCHFWPALHRGALGVPLVVSFAISAFGTSRVAAYGASMGGDVLLSSLVFERRLCALVCDRAAPDWLRPGSQGNALECRCADDAADASGARERLRRASDELYAQCPQRQLASFHAHPTALLFLCGEEDVHVPRQLSERFVDELRRSGAYAAVESGAEGDGLGSGGHVDRLRVVALPSGGWLGHVFQSPAEVTEHVLHFFDHWATD